jgi:transcriptional regulator with XRE-family HTH domain
MPARMARPDPYVVAVGKALRERRLERGLSQEDLALESGVHRNYVGGIERGERSPTIATIVKLCACLDAKPADLFNRAGELAP